MTDQSFNVVIFREGERDVFDLLETRDMAGGLVLETNKMSEHTRILLEEFNWD